MFEGFNCSDNSIFFECKQIIRMFCWLAECMSHKSQNYTHLVSFQNR